MPKKYRQVIAFLSSFRLKENNHTRIAYVEDLVKHMGLGIPSSTMAVYAANWGLIIGALRMDGWKVELVRPQEWQKTLGLGITGRQRANVTGMTPGEARAEKDRVRLLNSQLKYAWKKKLHDEAKRLCPHLTVTLKTADALLILEYGLRKHASELPLG